MHLKNLKTFFNNWIPGSSPKMTRAAGFSFIEIMVALTLLAIFGTSLFLTQTNLLQKLLKTHTSVINLFETDQQLLQFQQQVQQALQQKKSPESVKLHHENKQLLLTTDIQVKRFSSGSKFFKDFEKTVGLVQATTQQDHTSEQWWSFIYLVAPKEDEKKDKEAKSAKVAS